VPIQRGMIEGYQANPNKESDFEEAFESIGEITPIGE